MLAAREVTAERKAVARDRRNRSNPNRGKRHLSYGRAPRLSDGKRHPVRVYFRDAETL